ncbi:DUF3073 domain-containing protein [Micropruina sp.]|uniref:DUF3073 domain-containing protein n=1 Tax=Micropruina sp. TaxID=2737536 RepID=UPI002609434F|nr:DUF3073 domain-containing protein [Micropruina sp.]
MGRGRAKAKQTRVARDLKYRSYDTDFASLERELRGDHYSDPVEDDVAEDDDDEDDPYAELATRYADSDDGDGRRFG